MMIRMFNKFLAQKGQNLEDEAVRGFQLSNCTSFDQLSRDNMIRMMFIDPKPFTNHLFTVNFSLDICVIQKKARQEKLAKIKSLKRQKAKPSELTLTQMVGGADKDTNTEVNLINSSFC